MLIGIPTGIKSIFICAVATNTAQCNMMIELYTCIYIYYASNNYIYEENKEEQLRLNIGMDLWMRIAKFNLSKWRAAAVTCVVHKCVAMPVNIIIICKCEELYDDVAAAQCNVMCKRCRLAD